MLATAVWSNCVEKIDRHEHGSICTHGWESSTGAEAGKQTTGNVRAGLHPSVSVNINVQTSVSKGQFGLGFLLARTLLAYTAGK